jgi:hypothetical protein
MGDYDPWGDEIGFVSELRRNLDLRKNHFWWRDHGCLCFGDAGLVSDQFRNRSLSAPKTGKIASLLERYHITDQENILASCFLGMPPHFPGESINLSTRHSPG